MIEKYLEKIGFTTKESLIYLSLLEFGIQPAATIAKKTNIPKSTTLFILENLTRRGYIQKSKRGITQFFYATPKDLQQAKQKQHQTEQEALNEAIPLLNEYKSPFSSQPKTTFHEGVTGCKKAYLQLLESTEEILEFGIHKDLEEKFGKKFMKDFIKNRCKKSIPLRAISSDNSVDKALQRLDKKQMREQKFLPKNAETYSSIAIWENKVLLLNLHQDAFGILIENDSFSQTLRTIFECLYTLLPQD